jgi:hypothetical protein
MARVPVEKGSLLMYKLARGINAGTVRPAIVSHVHDTSTSPTADIESRVVLTVFTAAQLDGEGEQQVKDARVVASEDEAQQGEAFVE